MKTKQKIIFWAFNFSLIAILSGFIVKSSGAHISSTGAPGEETCNIAYCHDDASVEQGDIANTFIFSGTNNTYEPGVTYNVTIRCDYDNIERFGFQVTALNSSNQKVGTFAITNSTRTQIQNGSGRQYVTHKVGGTMASSVGTNEWSFNWTAPSTSGGIITFYYATQATNNDNTNSGDMIFLSSAEISPGVGIMEEVNEIGLNVHYDKSINSIKLAFNAKKGNRIDAKLYDLKGAVIGNISSKNLIKGSNILSFPLSHFLTNGIYILDAEIDGVKINKKIYIN